MTGIDDHATPDDPPGVTADVHAASIVGLALVGLIAAAVAVAELGRDRVGFRPPSTRSVGDDHGATYAPATDRVQVLARLREIRAKFRGLRGTGQVGDGADAPGSAAEVDRLIGELIRDHERPGKGDDR